MRSVERTWAWGVACVVLITASVLCTVLATVIVDWLLIRPMPASVNTLLPGWTYGSVAVLKVCLIAGVAAGIVFCGVQRRWLPMYALATFGPAGTTDGDLRNGDTSKTTAPVMAIVSVVLPSVTPLVGALGVIVAQALMSASGRVSMSDVQQISCSGVVVMAVCLAAGLVAGGLAIARGEPPRTLSLLGVTTNACLIAVFWYCKFHVIWLDQDRWVAR